MSIPAPVGNAPENDPTAHEPTAGAAADFDEAGAPGDATWPALAPATGFTFHGAGFTGEAVAGVAVSTAAMRAMVVAKAKRRIM